MPPRIAHEAGTDRAQIQAETMRNMSIAGNGLSSMEAGLFQQIAMFSAGGLVMSMTLVVVGGLRILYPWF